MAGRPPQQGPASSFCQRAPGTTRTMLGRYEQPPAIQCVRCGAVYIAPRLRNRLRFRRLSPHAHGTISIDGLMRLHHPKDTVRCQHKAQFLNWVVVGSYERTIERADSVEIVKENCRRYASLIELFFHDIEASLLSGPKARRKPSVVLIQS